MARRGMLLVTTAAAMLLLWRIPLLFSEVVVYKVGLVLTFCVAAMGLHILVNWAGELSLAHATFVGFPAFLVAKIAADTGVSVLVLLPVAVLAGALLGVVVGVPALRTRGLQVALVTLAAGVAIDRFFFTKPWFVGAAYGRSVEAPSLGPFEFPTSRSLYVVMVVLFVAVVCATWILYNSKIYRALVLVKSDPKTAAAFGVPVAAYRILAYAIAGGIAGLAGGMTTTWVQALSPQGFGLTQSFNYLVVSVLAGPGYVVGVIVAASSLEGARLFIASAGIILAYIGPIGLIGTVTTYKAGFNGVGRQLMRRLRTRTRAPDPASSSSARRTPHPSPDAIDSAQVGGRQIDNGDVTRAIDLEVVE